MYSLKIRIHPRIYKENLSENGGDTTDTQNKKETPEEELTRKEWFNNIIDIIGSKTNRADALVIMNAIMQGDFQDKWKKDIQVLNYHVQSLFDHDGEKKENFLSRVNDIKKAFGIKNMENIGDDKKGKFDEFSKKNPITSYKNEILTFILKNPQVATGNSPFGKNIISEKRKELDSLNIGAMNEYEAVLQTAENIIENDSFGNNTGGFEKFISGKKTKLQMELFEKYIRDSLNTAAEIKKPQSIDSFTSKEFKNLTIEEEKILLERSPDIVYDEFIKGLGVFLDEKRLTKDLAKNYIDGLAGTIFPILDKLGPNHRLKNVYENKIIQMRALAENDILYNNFGIFSGFFDGKSLKNFFIEAEKGKNMDGSIGYDKNGTFKFYTVNEMGEAIMKTGEITGTYDTAWDNYISGSKNDFSKLEGIFRKDELGALAIYLDQKEYKSTIIDKNPSFKEFIIKYLPKDFAINKENYSEKIEELTIQKDFPNLEKIIKQKGLKMPEQLPKTTDGSIDGVKLIFAIIEGNPTPENIKSIKSALDTDFEMIKSGAKQKKLEIVESLKEFKDWKHALEYFDIKSPLTITGSIDSDISIEQQNTLKDQLKLKQIELYKNPQSEENNKKLKTIKKLLELITADKTGSDASVSQSAMKQADSNNMVNASGNKDAEEKIAKSTHTNARAIVEQQKLDDFQKRNTEIIQSLSTKYNLPLDPNELANPQYLNQINALIATLGKKEKLTPDEEIFLDYLQRSKGQVRLNSQSINAHQELAKSYPEFKETLSNIRETNKVVYENLTPQKLEQYEHIARFIFPEDPISEMKRDLANMPPGSELELVNYYSNSDIGNGMRSSISIEDCSFTKTGGNSGTVNFPSYMGIPSMKGVPIDGIESFLSQADLFVRLGFRSLIPAMGEINKEVSKKYGKGTNSLDGSFDSYELRRTSTILCEIIGIKLTGNEAIPDITNKINAKYPTDGDIRKRLKEMEILSEEGDFRKFSFQEIVQNMDNKKV